MLRWHPVSERFEIEKAGTVGAFPPSVDNGWLAWDNVADELWGNMVNPWNVPSIYTPATQTWRPVTLAEFPTFDWSGNASSLRGVFNPGVASNGRYIVVYGGNSDAGPMAHLWVADCQAPKATRWTRFTNYGIGPGKPGPQGYIQMQCSWNVDLGLFIFCAGGFVWTLDPADWTWRARPTTGPAPPNRSTICLSRPGAGQLVACGGETANIWLLDLRTWVWSVIVDASMPADHLPRWDGIGWLEGDALYVGYGWGMGAPGTSQDIFRYVLPPSGEPLTLQAPLAVLATVA